jgi:hypothetical protein
MMREHFRQRIPIFFFFILSLLPSQAQDSSSTAHVYLHTFDGRSSIATWLTRIAINSATPFGL